MNAIQILFIVACAGVVITISSRRAGLPFVVFVGFALRSLLALYDNYGEKGLPWSGFDSIHFHDEMMDYLQGSVSQVFWEAPFSSSEMFPWVCSWFARVFGSEYLFMVFLMVILGTLNIFLIRRVGDEFLSKRFSQMLAWCLCLYPVTAVLSAVFIRETLIATFIIAAFYYLTLVVKYGKTKDLIKGSVMVLGAALFHGAMIACLVLFPLSYIAANWLTRTKNERTTSPVLILILTAACFAGIIAFGPKLSKIGDVTNIAENLSKRADRESRRMTARDADYPVFLSQNIYRPDIAILRFCYFMFAPFPWSCRGIADILGSLIGLFNLFLILFILRAVFKYKLSVIPTTLFMMFIATSLMFSTSCNNVGTGIRHRNKAIAGLFCAAVAAYEMQQRVRMGGGYGYPIAPRRPGPPPMTHPGLPHTARVQPRPYSDRS